MRYILYLFFIFTSFCALADDDGVVFNYFLNLHVTMDGDKSPGQLINYYVIDQNTHKIVLQDHTDSNSFDIKLQLESYKEEWYNSHEQDFNIRDYKIIFTNIISQGYNTAIPIYLSISNFKSIFISKPFDTNEVFIHQQLKYTLKYNDLQQIPITLDDKIDSTYPNRGDEPVRDFPSGRVFDDYPRSVVVPLSVTLKYNYKDFMKPITNPVTTDVDTGNMWP